MSLANPGTPSCSRMWLDRPPTSRPLHMLSRRSRRPPRAHLCGLPCPRHSRPQHSTRFASSELNSDSAESPAGVHTSSATGPATCGLRFGCAGHRADTTNETERLSPLPLRQRHTVTQRGRGGRPAALPGSQSHIWRCCLVSPPWPRPRCAPGTYVRDGAPVGDGALGGYPRARDALADASSWSRAQGRPWKT